MTCLTSSLREPSATTRFARRCYTLTLYSWAMLNRRIQNSKPKRKKINTGYSFSIRFLTNMVLKRIWMITRMRPCSSFQTTPLRWTRARYLLSLMKSLIEIWCSWTSWMKTFWNGIRIIYHLYKQITESNPCIDYEQTGCTIIPNLYGKLYMMRFVWTTL